MAENNIKSAQEEIEAFRNEVSEFETFARSSRFKYTVRPYSAESVVSLRGTYYETPLSNLTAKKLYKLCRRRYNNKRYTHTFGALDPVQVVQMAKYLECVYVSGWQSSSTASTSNEPGPDFADYPANTVPNKVDQLFRAQLFHDRRQREERSHMSVEQLAKTPKVDYFRPIIADGDTGFGGITSVMKMVKLQIEAGAAAVHIEDQKGGAKKCGHMGGKVLVSTSEHLDRLAACRLQADIMNTETVIIARTDACGASFIDTNIDARDQPYIAGTTNETLPPLEQTKDEGKWIAQANLCRYTDAILQAMRKKGTPETVQTEWKEKSMNLSNADARKYAASLGFSNVFWCWEKPRSREGFYRLVPGVDFSAARAVHFSPLSDLIWMETATPDISEARLFSDLVHKKIEHQMLAYNLSPSFNWDAGDVFKTDKEIMRFQVELGKLGFVWQFITLAGFHSNSLGIDKFAKSYAGKKGVYAYVEMIQREERRLGVETLLHQKWSGAQYMDRCLEIATGGKASTLSLEGATEDQFSKTSHSKHKGSSDDNASDSDEESSLGGTGVVENKDDESSEASVVLQSQESIMAKL